MHRYYFINDIAYGGFGLISLYLDTETGNEVAIKQIYVCDDKTGVLASTLREITFSKHLQHQNIISLIDSFLISEKNQYCLVYPFYPITLRDFLRYNFPLDFSLSMDLFRQILEAYEYIHSKNVMHRDVKLHNIMYDQEHEYIKIIDFGISKEQLNPSLDSTQHGTKFFLAPEMMLNYQQYNEKSDVWGIGLILAYLLSNYYMFPCKQDEEGLNLIFQLLGTPPEPLLSCYRHMERWTLYYEIYYLTPMQLALNQYLIINKYLPNATPRLIHVFFRMLDLDFNNRISCAEALAELSREY